MELKHSSGVKKAVLLLHGMTGAPSELAYLGRYLFAAGFDVYIPVLPGHCSSTEALKRTLWQDWYNFSINEYDKLKEDYDEVHVSGICLGAVLALCIASERKSVKSVACLSTTLFLDGWGIPWIIFMLPLALYTVIKFFYAWPESGSLGVKNDSVRVKVQKSMEKENSDILDCFPTLCILQIIRLSKFARKNFYKVEAPTLIIHSDRDDITSPKGAYIVFNKINSKIREFIRLRNSFHLIVLDNEKDFVFERTRDFFLRS